MASFSTVYVKHILTNRALYKYTYVTFLLNAIWEIAIVMAMFSSLLGTEEIKSLKEYFHSFHLLQPQPNHKLPDHIEN